MLAASRRAHRRNNGVLHAHIGIGGKSRALLRVKGLQSGKQPDDPLLHGVVKIQPGTHGFCCKATDLRHLPCNQPRDGLFVSVPGLFDLHAEDIVFHGYSICLFLDYLILLLFKKKVKFNRRARVIFVRFCL